MERLPGSGLTGFGHRRIERRRVLVDRVVRVRPEESWIPRVDRIGAGLEALCRLAGGEAIATGWRAVVRGTCDFDDVAGLEDRVMVLTFSEFGRRVAENASQGTDHGAAAPAFLSGPRFEKTILGAQPSLSELDDGDLKFHTDFRRVYATLIEDWLGASSKAVLNEAYLKIAI